jgi:hypothetical protein
MRTIKLCIDCCEDITGKPGRRCHRCAHERHLLQSRENATKQNQRRYDKELTKFKMEMRKIADREAREFRQLIRSRKMWYPSLEGIDELEPDLYCPERNG